MKKYPGQVVLKLRLAQKYLEQAIATCQKDPLSLTVIEQSQKAQALLNEANDLMAGNHLDDCIANLIRKGQMNKAEIEVKRLSKYNLPKI